MPRGKGTYGSKVGRPKKKNGMRKKSGRKGLKPCLTPKQKKLPKALQAGIRKKNRPCR